jgi:hypothetical protein
VSFLAFEPEGDVRSTTERGFRLSPFLGFTANETVGVMQSITEGLNANETVGVMQSITEGLNINRKSFSFSQSNETRVDVRSTDIGLNIDRKPKPLLNETKICIIYYQLHPYQ